MYQEQTWGFMLKCVMHLCAGRKGGASREHVQSSATRLHSHGYPGDEGAQVAAAPRKKAHSNHTKVGLEGKKK